MENATKALEIGFGVLIFVVALSLSISTFSNATRAITNIMTNEDKTQSYVYVTEANGVDENNNRIVGVETIVPAMYKAYKENYKILFLDQNGNPITLYYKTRNSSKETEIVDGESVTVLPREKDDYGEEIEINFVDLEEEVLGGVEDAIQHLDFILYGNNYQKDDKKYYTKYKRQIYYPDGLYDFLVDKKFIEILGEYYQEDAEAGTEIPETQVAEINKTKKRIITYKLYQ